MKRLLVVFAALMIDPNPRLSQNVTVAGTVVDASGGLVPGATVDLANDRIRVSTTTGSRGEFSFEVEPGTYELTVSLVGFAQVTQSVAAAAGGAPIPLTLSAAGRSEIVV